MTNCFVAQLDLALAEKLRLDLKEQGFELLEAPYALFQAKKKGISITLYTSGKLTVQGKEMKSFIENYLEPEILGTFTFGYESILADKSPRIGIDESGKGDFFGPLCIAGIYAGEKEIEALFKLGVKDSKKISDPSILKLAVEIEKICPHHSVRIFPLKYNELIEKFGNLNLLLGWGHATVIEALHEKTGCKKVIIDQFAAEHVVENALKRKKIQLLLTQRHRGEEDVVVAGASILARACFLEGLKKLEKAFDMPLPKGASQEVINVGKALVEKNGVECLSSIGKLHFKTMKSILNV